MEITLLGEKIKVIIQDELIEEGEEISGLFDPETLTIYLSQKSQNMRQVFLHEVNHATLYLSGIPDGSLPFMLDEIICDLLARGVDQIMTQKCTILNP